ncbi:hypothetical protein V6N12_041672 [Hibiscus sabdariffa]|uniref:Cation/H+ exchanger domain-containing protein n=1 Tax=Hibiscus sabdariffa TaxID=183260 RepID=A0ABR2BKC9_9ROSI
MAGWVTENLIPFEAGLFLETMANLGVTFYMFLVGLEMDLTPLRKIERTALTVAIAGIVLPVAVGVGVHTIVLKLRENIDVPEMGAYFWSIALSHTSFPDLARILSDPEAHELYVAIPVLLCMTIFWFSLRPFIRKVVRHISVAEKEKPASDKHLHFILSLVFLSGFITELCGAHSFFGAFMFGLMIPGGELGTNIKNKNSSVMVFLVILVAISAKIVGALLVCLFFKSPMRDGLALGLLMNTKGVLAVIIINEGRNMKGFDQQTYSWIVVAILLMTVIIGPVVSYTHRSARHLRSYNEMHLERSKPDTPLRVLACVHSTRNLSGLISLLQISNVTRKSPITVFAVHLVELAGRTSAMLIFHDKNKTIDTGNNCSREKAEAEQIVSAFESFENENHGATVRPLTAVSPYASMHEDVNNFALDRFANIILIPFHKQPDTSGGWTAENLQHELVNQNLLQTSPCSIGLLVDRGLTCFPESQKGTPECRVSMLFVEGPDDREALAYAWRMAGSPNLMLTLVRFVPGKEVSEFFESDDEQEIFPDRFERERQKQLDDDYINVFRSRTMHDQSITYIEKQVSSGDQIVSALSSAYNDFDLYVVGRGHDRTSPLTSGLSNWSEFPELGPLGETLVLMDLESPASVLIVQQSCPESSGSKKTKTSDQNLLS